ncbi:hypothetical protein FRC10_008889 [Ceratobasidium sp. 414]|nr:hypothetical protein FRC10_008889 [Ceratobasidium sp. 414]
MSDLKEAGFGASDIIVGLGSAFDKLSDAQKKQQIKKAFKKDGTVKKGPASGKPDVVISLSETFTELATGKLNGQKAFMTGKLKVRELRQLHIKRMPNDWLLDQG